MKKCDIIREVAFEVDGFELKHYNEEIDGCFERVQEDLDQIREVIDKAADERLKDSERLKRLNDLSYKVDIPLANTTCEIDQMESIGVQNGLIRSSEI